MADAEYKVVPAPRRAGKVRGVRGTEARFAHTLAEFLNEMAADGWEFLRSERLAVEERSGLFSRRTEEQTVLIFRRDAAPAGVAQPAPALAGAGGRVEAAIPFGAAARRGAPERKVPPLSAVPTGPRDERPGD
ncbi:MAG: DUF4177 domain-containing protein [Alphaproteobacteria bacterium HGW-Alphaproteobacteria-2]|nr:MAG: DUF4177 domain-containing protein [Alphaproteobacteria bacterium HGW-Alphaproteobacteria-2]